MFGLEAPRFRDMIATVNIRDLAARVKLSRSTVSLALRNSPGIADGTRRRVQQAAKELGYFPNPTVANVMSAIAQRKLSGLSTPIILLSDFPHQCEWERSDYALRRFYHGVVSRAGDLGYKIEELWMRAPGMTPRRIEQILDARGIEGVLVFNYPSAPAYLDIDLTPYSCAVLGRALLKPRLYAVEQDHHQGMFICLDNIKQHGYFVRRSCLTRWGMSEACIVPRPPINSTAANCRAGAGFQSGFRREATWLNSGNGFGPISLMSS